MTDKIKTRKNIFVKADIDVAALGLFEQDIRLNFTPDEMIVRSWSAGTATGGDGAYTMYMHGVGDLFEWQDQDTSTPRLVYQIGRNIDGINKFEVHDVDGAIDIGIVCKVIFVLEFVEYYKN